MFEGFKPMLAEKAPEDLTKLDYPVLVSKKLDGIRCLVVGGKALTRSLNPIPNDYLRGEIELFFSQCREIENLVFDGELLVGRSHQDTSSGVMSKDKTFKGLSWAYGVFDLYDQRPMAAPFVVRLRRAQTLIDRTKLFMDTSYDGNRTPGDNVCRHIAVLPHKYVSDAHGLLAAEREVLEAGFEGLMIRDPDGPYKFGRSTVSEGYLLKLKRFVDGEAEIVGFEELCENTNAAETDALGHTKRSSQKAGMVPKNTLGALVLRLGDCEFRCGTGFDADTRQFVWDHREEYLGKLAKVKYQAVGMKYAPRHPVFLGIRDERDL